MFYLHLPEITAVIHDFDYRHVISFLNKLGEHEVRALSVESERNMIFETHVDTVSVNRRKGDLGIGDAPKLESWLRRLEHPTKKGTQLAISHVMLGDQNDMSWWWSALYRLRGRFNGDRASVVLQDMIWALEDVLAD